MTLKIVYIHQYFNTPSMAGGTRSYEMGRRLVEYGHQVEMITSYRKANTQDSGRLNWFQTEEDGIRVHWLPVPYSNNMSYRKRMRAFITFAIMAARKAASINCDIVFATSTPLTISLPAVYASRKNKVPMVFEVRDLWPELPIAVGALKNPLLKYAGKRLELFAYNNAKYVVALSPGMKKGVVSTGYPAERIEVIPNSCNLDIFNVGLEPGRKLREKYDWLKDRPLVIYTGTIGYINGVDYLARLACFVRELDKEIRFLIIGSGQGEGKLRKEAERLDVLNDNLFMMPRVPKHEMPAWLSAADLATSLFIDLKEMWSNSANKFFDALAAGTPVAINYSGWQADIINKSEAGVVLDPHNYQQAAKVVAEKIRDKKWLWQASKAAIKIAGEEFDREKLAKELEAVLKKAVSDT